MPILDAEIRAIFESQGLLLNRAESPTTASTDLYKALLRTGIPGNPEVKIRNFGQGAEIESWPPLREAYIRNGSSGTNAVYRAPHKPVIDVMRGWGRRFFGLSGEPLVGVTQGRGPVDAALRVGLVKGKETGHVNVAMPEYYWTALDEMLDVLKLSGGQVVPYPNPSEDGQFHPESLGNLDEMAVLYLNPQHNPTGKIYPARYLMGLKSHLDAINSHRVNSGQRPITVIVDSPYFHTLQIDEDSAPAEGRPYYGSSGMSALMDDNGITPYIAVFSFSKALGTARPGLFACWVHPSLKPAVKTKLHIQSFTASGDDRFLDAVAEVFIPENDNDMLHHLTGKRDKYGANLSCLQKALYGLEGVEIVDGDPGMTSLLKLDEGFFGRKPEGPITGEYEINDTSDLVEFLALNYGVVAVDNGPGLLRLANALQPEDYAQGVAALRAGFENILVIAPEPNFDADHELPREPTAEI